jgi:hypothetical protein
MKLLIPAIAIMGMICSCNSHSPAKEKDAMVKVPDSTVSVPEKKSFFPVTDYLKGQLFEIRQRQLNPKRYITIKGHTDSAWLKIEDIPTAMREFLTPVIDSMNLVSLFTEKKFLDQTLEAFTFTYDPVDILPDSMKLVHWDVYVNQETGKVKRIYMVKHIDDTKIMQLTWVTDKWFKITTLLDRPDGSSVVVKEEKVSWETDN